jgi:two-component system response regulator RstA
MSIRDELALLVVEETADRAGLDLERPGVIVTRVTDAAHGLREALRRVHDAVVVDLLSPAEAGVALCRELRAHSDVPLIMVAEGLEEADRVSALEAGADDCVLKPFSPVELLARIHAAVRRARRLSGPPAVLHAGPLALFTTNGTVTLNGKPLEVTSYEFAILRVLAERRGRVLTREQILDYAKGGSENAFERSIDVRISRLRRKLGDPSGSRSIIRTVRGIGYSLTSD